MTQDRLALRRGTHNRRRYRAFHHGTVELPADERVGCKRPALAGGRDLLSRRALHWTRASRAGNGTYALHENRGSCNARRVSPSRTRRDGLANAPLLREVLLAHLRNFQAAMKEVSEMNLLNRNS
jgi:hypothetical protein